MSEIKTNNLIFTDDDKARLVMSENFNFALDKESGISACWGKSINESPDYDPIAPQEIIFKIDEKFNLVEYLKMFNFIANIKVKIDKTEFTAIEDEIAATAQDNLTCLSTLASVVLIFDKSLNDISIDELLKFTKYIRKFSVSVIIQINCDEEFTYSELTKLKLLGTSIQIKTDDNFNAEKFIKNIKQLKENNILTSAKINVNTNSYEEVSKLPELLDKESSLKLHFVLPYVTTAEYVDLQKKFNKAELLNARIATCAHEKFNKRKANIHMAPVDCDASRFSVYVENGTIYPCEYAKTDGCKIADCKSIHDFWYCETMTKMRNYISENNFCKFIGK